MGDETEVEVDAVAAAEDLPPEQQADAAGATDDGAPANPADGGPQPESDGPDGDGANGGPEGGYLEDLQRVQAEFANYRRRVQAQQAEQAERATESIVGKLLPVLDAGELAIAHGGAEAEAVAKVTGMLMDTLQKEGLEGINPGDGDPFDPEVHDAVAHEEGDAEHPVVSELLRSGYRWKGRLIRPAMVKTKG